MKNNQQLKIKRIKSAYLHYKSKIDLLWCQKRQLINDLSKNEQEENLKKIRAKINA